MLSPLHAVSSPPVSSTGNAIAALPLFQGMETELLNGLITSSRQVEHDKGTVFLTQGQPVSRFYIILDGWCGASKGNVEGQEAILQIFRRGDFFPEPDHGAHIDSCPVSIKALTHIRLLMLSPSIVKNALERSSAFKATMFAASMQKCQELRDHIEQLTLHSAEQRVGQFLLQMRFYTDLNGQTIVLPFDKSLIAAYLGIKPETLSRTLQLFKDKGFVVERDHLTVPNHQALCDYCDWSTKQTCHFAQTDACSDSDHRHTSVS